MEEQNAYPPKLEELFSQFLNIDLNQETLVKNVEQSRSEMSDDLWSELFICVCGMVLERALILVEFINPNYVSANHKNWMPLHAAIAAPLGENATLALLKRTSHPGRVDVDGRSALHLALMHDYSFEFINTLCDSGLDYNAPDEYGMTPLHLAVMFVSHNSPAIRKKIIERLLYKDSKKSAEEFPRLDPDIFRFFRAVRRQGKAVKEAAVTIVNAEGKTPLDIACEMGDQPIVTIIKEAFFTQLQQVTDEKLFKEMVECYAKHFTQAEWTNMFFHDFYSMQDERGLWFWHLINSRYSDRSGNTMMDMRDCLTNGYLLKLLEEGADIEHRSRRNNESLLDTAVRCGRWDMVETLQSRGVNINELNRWGYSYLYGACREGKKHIVAGLLQCKADPNFKNGKGWYEGEAPLHGLCESRCFSDYNDAPPESMRLEIAQMLVEAGANVEAQHNGKTPIDVAREWGRTALVELLENARRPKLSP